MCALAPVIGTSIRFGGQLCAVVALALAMACGGSDVTPAQANDFRDAVSSLKTRCGGVVSPGATTGGSGSTCEQRWDDADKCLDLVRGAVVEEATKCLEGKKACGECADGDCGGVGCINSCWRKAADIYEASVDDDAQKYRDACRAKVEACKDDEEKVDDDYCEGVVFKDSILEESKACFEKSCPDAKTCLRGVTTKYDGCAPSR